MYRALEGKCRVATLRKILENLSLGGLAIHLPRSREETKRSLPGGPVSQHPLHPRLPWRSLRSQDSGLFPFSPPRPPQKPFLLSQPSLSSSTGNSLFSVRRKRGTLLGVGTATGTRPGGGEGVEVNHLAAAPLIPPPPKECN